ncbi:MAG TPA: PAS domain S-box protein [Vicinamibacterales bacterium]|nr:PAS domain S-box protein [Vicinamibacterales bacterium]
MSSGGVVAAIAAVTLSEYAFGIDAGIDQLLFQESPASPTLAPGRMAPASALIFLLLGVTVALTDVAGAARIRQICVGITATLAFVALCGYIFGVSALHGMGHYASVALHTTVGFLAASAAYLTGRPTEGVMPLLTSETVAGVLVRRLVPAIVFLPVTLGWLRLLGQRAGLYDTPFGIALLVVGSVGALTLVTWRVAASLQESELGRVEVVANLAARERELTDAIAERHRADDQFRLAIEASPTGMIMSDAGGRIVLVNREVEQMFGYERSELIGQSVDKLVPPRFRGRPQLRKEFNDHPSVRTMGAGRELFGVRQNGTKVPVEIGLNPIQTAEGSFVLTSIVDTTERTRAEKERNRLVTELQALTRDLEERVQDRTRALREGEERFHTMANTISQLAWMTDETGYIFWYNDRWFEYTGTTLDEMAGWGWQKVHHPDYVGGVVERISGCFERGEIWDDTFPLRGRDGTYRWFLSRAVPIRNAERDTCCNGSARTPISQTARRRRSGFASRCISRRCCSRRSIIASRTTSPRFPVSSIWNRRIQRMSAWSERLRTAGAVFGQWRLYTRRCTDPRILR